MKIICESCRTKYSISDDKVRGKVFKIRCKKCNNVIVVKGTEGAGDGMFDSGVEGLGDNTGKPTMLSDPSLEAAMDSLEGEGSSGPGTMLSGGDGAEWHLAIGGEQVGPFTPEEVAQKFQSGEINSNTHIWKEGFSDWILLSAVPEFSHLAEGYPGAEAPSGDSEATNLYVGTPKPASADPFGDVSPSGADDLFGAPPAASPSNGPSEAADPFGQDDPFSGADSAGSGAAAMPIQNAPGGSMTGARSESSVLFSLTNLQALALGSKDAKAPPPAAATPQKAAPSATANTEGSGLIDIRSMSNALQFSKEKDKKDKEAGDILSFGGDSAAAFAGGMGSSVLLPVEQKSNTGMVVGAIVGGIVVVIGLVFGLLFGLGVFDKKETPTQTVIVTSNTPGAPAEAGGGVSGKEEGGKTEGTSESGVEVAALGPSEPQKNTKEPTGVAKTDPKANTKPGKEPAAAPTKNEPATPASPPAPEPTTPKETGGKKANADELDELLSGGSKSTKETTGGGGPSSLTNAQIQSVMSRANFSSCKAVGTGKVSVKVTISGSGSVSNVSSDGTPLGTCVAGVIRRLKFPSISSPSQTFPYPVFVR